MGGDGGQYRGDDVLQAVAGGLHSVLDTLDPLVDLHQLCQRLVDVCKLGAYHILNGKLDGGKHLWADRRGLLRDGVSIFVAEGILSMTGGPVTGVNCINFLGGGILNVITQA